MGAGRQPDVLPSCCRHRMQRAVTVCKAELDEAENAPASERMARIVANDEYGVALLGVAHKPRQSLEAFDRAIALLPAQHG